MDLLTEFLRTSQIKEDSEITPGTENLQQGHIPSFNRFGALVFQGFFCCC